MLSDFVTENRSEIVLRCRARVAARRAPKATAYELEKGIPAFIDQLALALKTHLPREDEDRADATQHGDDLLRQGFTVAQVVHDYGDVCQTITGLAIERDAKITTDEFKHLNLCLDNAIAQAVTAYTDHREHDVVERTTAEGAARGVEDLGVLAHELRNLLNAASLACEALRSGSVGIAGSTGAVLERSLAGMRDLIVRPLAAVRLHSGIGAPGRVTLAHVIEEVAITASIEARRRDLQLTFEPSVHDAIVVADHQILSSILTNLVQNALKFTHAHSHVTVRSSTANGRVQVEVEDQCGGLAPGMEEKVFTPFVKASTDQSGLGLGLTICRRGAEALGGTLTVRNLPGTGCVFVLELPLAPAA
jgi:signal transduction histidine kinase